MKLLLVALFTIFSVSAFSQKTSFDNIAGKKWYCLKNSCTTKSTGGEGGLAERSAFILTLSKEKTFSLENRATDNTTSGTFTVEGNKLVLKTTVTTTTYSLEFFHKDFLVLKKNNCYFYLVLN
jgi:hypothetical protein